MASLAENHWCSIVRISRGKSCKASNSWMDQVAGRECAVSDCTVEQQAEVATYEPVSDGKDLLPQLLALRLGRRRSVSRPPVAVRVCKRRRAAWKMVSLSNLGPGGHWQVGRSLTKSLAEQH